MQHKLSLFLLSLNMLNPVPVAFLFSIWGRRSKAVPSTHQTQKGKVQSCSRKHTCSPTCDNPGIPGSTMLRPGHLSFLTGADVVCTRLQEDFELCITLLDGIGMLPLMFAIGIWQGISLMASLELGTSLGFDGVLYVMLFSNSWQSLQNWDRKRVRKACCNNSLWRRTSTCFFEWKFHCLAPPT